MSITPDYTHKAISAGVVPVLQKLLAGSLSWIEQRTAMRALSIMLKIPQKGEASEGLDYAACERNVLDLAALVPLVMDLCVRAVEIVWEKAIRDPRKLEVFMIDLMTRGRATKNDAATKAISWAEDMQENSVIALRNFSRTGISYSNR